MTYEATLYGQAREAFLQDVSHMNLRNDQFAEKKGGVAVLDTPSRQAYDMNRDRLIRLVQYHDAAQQYIEQLHNWIDELIYKNRELSEKEYGWKALFPPVPHESANEHKRWLRLTEVQMLQPELF